ncbi:uncharacterized protein LOC108677770 isoform X2 [Hyalella azteca]|uniref:Uncharacterized protein LOC108677770 isoform X2 n=1 Tax=Hyalella azteca TaxID=294128 RepID=A0A8B7P8N8_HYAAZ|nr:uncharacterized protein LOC108677770 isoform X2 [Hyalella azteca]
MASDRPIMILCGVLWVIGMSVFGAAADTSVEPEINPGSAFSQSDGKSQLDYLRGVSAGFVNVADGSTALPDPLNPPSVTIHRAETGSARTTERSPATASNGTSQPQTVTSSTPSAADTAKISTGTLPTGSSSVKPKPIKMPDIHVYEVFPRVDCRGGNCDADPTDEMGKRDVAYLEIYRSSEDFLLASMKEYPKYPRIVVSVYSKRYAILPTDVDVEGDGSAGFVLRIANPAVRVGLNERFATAADGDENLDYVDVHIDDEFAYAGEGYSVPGFGINEETAPAETPESGSAADQMIREFIASDTDDGSNLAAQDYEQAILIDPSSDNLDEARSLDNLANLAERRRKRQASGSGAAVFPGAAGVAAGGAAAVFPDQAGVAAGGAAVFPGGNVVTPGGAAVFPGGAGVVTNTGVTSGITTPIFPGAGANPGATSGITTPIFPGAGANPGATSGITTPIFPGAGANPGATSGFIAGSFPGVVVSGTRPTIASGFNTPIFPGGTGTNPGATSGFIAGSFPGVVVSGTTPAITSGFNSPIIPGLGRRFNPFRGIGIPYRVFVSSRFPVNRRFPLFRVPRRFF